MRQLPFLLLILTGCPPVEDKADTGSGPDDTGEDTDVTYESGCITIDGGGGYAKIADAITLAQEGSVIALCAGAYEEAVTVDKSVTIRGEATGGTTLAGPGSDIPLTITGANVTVENLTLESARTGLSLDGATGATITNVTVAAAGSWGVSSSDATATFTDLAIVEPGSGGMEISGGDVTIAGLTIDYPGGFGVLASDDAVVSVDSATITGTLLLGEDVTLDGHAFNVDGATLSVSSSTIAGADGIGFSVIDGDVVLTDVTVTDAVYLAIYSFDSTWDITGLMVTGTILQGIYATGPSFSIADSTIAADSTLSCSYTYAEWGVDYGPWCGGFLVGADEINVSNINVMGWNNYGFYTAPYNGDTTNVTVSGGYVYDVGRFGAYFYGSEGTVDGLTVSQMRDPEQEDPCVGYINQSAAVLADTSNLTLTNTTVSNNVGWGVSALFGTIAIQDSTFDGNDCIGFVNYENEGSVTGSTFTNGSDSGSVYDSGGVLVVDGNTFTSNKTGTYTYYDYMDEYGYIYTYEASGGQGNDLVAYLSAAVYVTNNTFTSGDTSLQFSSVGEAEVTGNTWSDYEGSLAYFYQVGSTAIFADNTADDIAGAVVEASNSSVEVSNVQVGTTRASVPVEVTYSYDYADDTQDFSGSYTSSSSSYVFYVSGYYYDDGAGTITEYPGSLVASDVTVGSAYSTLVYTYDAEVDLTGFDVGDVGGSVVYGNWYNFAPDVEVSDLTVGTASSTAFNLYNYYASFGSLALTDVTMTGAYAGVSTQSIGAVDLTNVAFGDLTYGGVSTTSRSYDYDYVYDETTGSYSVVYTDLDSETEVTASNVSITSAGGDAFELEGGSANLSGLTVSSTAGDGVSASGLTALTIADATFSSAGGAGVVSADSYSAYSYETSTYDVVDADTVATLTNVSVDTPRGSAFAFQGGSLLMSGCTGITSGYSGLELSGVTADIQGNTFTGNTEYGMTCEETTLSTCATNVLDDNTLGAHLDCSDSCSDTLGG